MDSSAFSEQATNLWLPGGSRYTFALPSGRGYDFRIEIADLTYQEHPELPLLDVNNLVEVGTYGDGGKLSGGLSVDTVRIQTDREAYELLGLKCVAFSAYLAN